MKFPVLPSNKMKGPVAVLPRHGPLFQYTMQTLGAHKSRAVPVLKGDYIATAGFRVQQHRLRQKLLQVEEREITRGGSPMPTEGIQEQPPIGEETSDEDDLDVEMTLMALTEDMGGPMEDVDISMLSPTERRALLHYLQQELGLSRKIQDN